MTLINTPPYRNVGPVATVVPFDPQYSLVTFLAHFTGVQDSTTMPEQHSITLARFGSAKIDTGVDKWPDYEDYDGVLKLSVGTNDYLTFSQAQSYTADYTQELWIYPTVLGGSLFGNYAGFIENWEFQLGSNGSVIYRCGVNANPMSSASGLVALNTWSHIAATRSGSTVRLFVNGVLVSSQTQSGTVGFNGNTVGIGGRSNGAILFKGYIAEVRITKGALNSGACRYTTAFTPPIFPFANSSA